jgi:hypothetical protein
MGQNSGHQLSLFPKADPILAADDPDKINVTWSYSRRSILERCARQYYFEYFGANKKTAKQEANKATLHFLKGVPNRYLRAGDILHLVIATYFRKAQANIIWDADRLINWAKDIFQRDQDYSRQHPAGDFVPNINYPPKLLREYHYQLPNADELYAVEEERLFESLYAFATDPVFEEFREGGCGLEAVVEKRFRLTGANCVIGGRIDLAYVTPDRVTVVDWKLGGSTPSGAASLQLATYGLWATEHFGKTPDKIGVYKAHLSTCEVVSFRMDDEILRVAQARIAQDAENMAQLEDYGNRGLADAFTPCLQPLVCRSCSFEKVCYD